MAILGPRKYQLEILDHAMRENTLAFLPTGSGKTLISVLLIKYYLTEINTQIQNGNEKQLIVFLAPTKILVGQQSKYLTSNTNAKIRSYTGDTKSSSGSILDNWNIDNWSHEINEVDIMVMTPEIMRNILERNLISLTKFALFILDECHHAFGKDPMASVCRYINNTSHQYHPRILGLTASPLPCKKGSIKHKINELEKITGCKIITPVDSLEDLFFHVPKPQLYTLRSSLSSLSSTLPSVSTSASENGRTIHPSSTMMVDEENNFTRSSTTATVPSPATVPTPTPAATRVTLDYEYITQNPSIFYNSNISPHIYEIYKNNPNVMSSIYPIQSRIYPMRSPVHFFYSIYYRIRQGQHLQEIIILLNTLHANIADLSQLHGLERYVATLRENEQKRILKDPLPLYISDLELLIGQLGKISCDCGIISCIFAFISALTTTNNNNTTPAANNLNNLNNLNKLQSQQLNEATLNKNENEKVSENGNEDENENEDKNVNTTENEMTKNDANNDNINEKQSETKDKNANLVIEHGYIWRNENDALYNQSPLVSSMYSITRMKKERNRQNEAVMTTSFIDMNKYQLVVNELWSGPFLKEDLLHLNSSILCDPLELMLVTLFDLIAFFIFSFDSKDSLHASQIYLSSIGYNERQNMESKSSWIYYLQILFQMKSKYTPEMIFFQPGTGGLFYSSIFSSYVEVPITEIEGGFQKLLSHVLLICQSLLDTLTADRFIELIMNTSSGEHNSSPMESQLNDNQINQFHSDQIEISLPSNYYQLVTLDKTPNLENLPNGHFGMIDPSMEVKYVPESVYGSYTPNKTTEIAPVMKQNFSMLSLRVCMMLRDLFSNRSNTWGGLVTWTNYENEINKKPTKNGENQDGENNKEENKIQNEEIMGIVDNGGGDENGNMDVVNHNEEEDEDNKDNDEDHNDNEEADSAENDMNNKRSSDEDHENETNEKEDEEEHEDSNENITSPVENEWAAIIFCKMRLTVLALNSLTNSLISKIAHAKLLQEVNKSDSKDRNKICSLLIRCNLVIGGYHMNLQSKRLLEFKAGLFNVLFATDIAEEGLDVRSCQRVINFDLPSTVKSYVQRRGRARAQNSIMLNLIPEDKTDEEIYNELILLLKQEEEMNEYDGSANVNSSLSDVMRCMIEENGYATSDGNELDSFTTGDYIDTETLSRLPDTEENIYRYVVPETGAIVDINNATQLLIHYCQHIPHDRYYKPDPIYWMSSLKAYTFSSSTTSSSSSSSSSKTATSSDPIPTLLYQCSILLPQFTLPQIRCMIGPIVSSKLLAKSLLSLECIKKLHFFGEIDNNLQSTNSRASIQRKKHEFEKLQAMNSNNSKDIKDENNPDGITKIDIKITPNHLVCDNSHDFSTNELYFYRFHSFCSNENHENYLNDCPTCSRYVQSMNLFGLIFHKEIPQDMMRELIDFYIRGIKIDVKIELIGKKIVSNEELFALQSFHRHILCWESSQQLNCSDLDSMNESQQQQQQQQQPFIIPPNEWKRSSLSAWYLIFPLGIESTTLSQNNLSFLSKYSKEFDLILSQDWVTYLTHCADETLTLVTNLFQHQNQTTSRHHLQQQLAQQQSNQTAASTPIHYDINYNQQSHHLYNKIFSRSGFGNIYIGCQSNHSIQTRNESNGPDEKDKNKDEESDAKYFHDPFKVVIDEETSTSREITFEEYYLSKGLLTSSEIAQIKQTTNQTSIPLIKSASFAGRLSLVQILDQVVTNSTIIEEKHSHTSISYLLPQHCVIIGDVKWMMIGLIAPSMIWRIQSLLLAVEAREKIFSLMPPNEPLQVIQSCPHFHQQQQISSSSTSSPSTYQLPSPSLMLKALTPRMTLEILDSERLEFIGDIILKYVVSWILFCQHWKKHEGFLSRARVEIISNSFLIKRCRHINLLPYLRAHTLSSGKQELFFSPPGRCHFSINNHYPLGDTNNTNPADKENNDLDKHIDIDKDKVKDIDNKPLNSSFSLWNINILKPVTKRIDNKLSHHHHLLTPRGSNETENGNENENIQSVPADVKGKRIADMLEALIGAFYESGGIDCAIGVIRAFGLWPSTNQNETLYPIQPSPPSSATTTSSSSSCPPAKEEIEEILPTIPSDYPIPLARIALGPSISSSSSSNHTSTTTTETTDTETEMTRASKPSSSSLSPSPSPSLSLLSQINVTQHTINYMKQTFGYEFKNLTLLDESLTHCSVIYKQSNQRLEYLGDAILDYSTMSVLYRVLPNSSQGQLSSLKSSLLCNANLIKISLKHKLYAHLFIMSIKLMNQFNEIELWSDENYSPSLGELGNNNSLTSSSPSLSLPSSLLAGNDNQEVKKNEENEKEKKINFIISKFDLKCLADAMEAIIGAIFIDSNCSVEVICEVIKKLEIIPKSYYENEK